MPQQPFQKQPAKIHTQPLIILEIQTKTLLNPPTDSRTHARTHVTASVACNTKKLARDVDDHQQPPDKKKLTKQD